MLGELESRNIIIRENLGWGRGYTKYKLNTDTQAWLTVTKLVTPKTQQTVTKSVTPESQEVLPKSEETVTENDQNCYQKQQKLLPLPKLKNRTINKDINKNKKESSPLPEPLKENGSNPSQKNQTSNSLRHTSNKAEVERVRILESSGKKEGKKDFNKCFYCEAEPSEANPISYEDNGRPYCERCDSYLADIFQVMKGNPDGWFTIRDIRKLTGITNIDLRSLLDKRPDVFEGKMTPTGMEYSLIINVPV